MVFCFLVLYIIAVVYSIQQIKLGINMTNMTDNQILYRIGKHIDNAIMSGDSELRDLLVEIKATLYGRQKDRRLHPRRQPRIGRHISIYNTRG